MNVHGLRVALRADASPIMGLGHVRRCLSLGTALKQAGASVWLVARDLGVPTAHLARAAGIEPLTLSAPVSAEAAADLVPHATWAGVDWRTDALESVRELRPLQPDWVVVDVYAFDARWHRLVGSELPAHIGVIDDLADRDLQADVLIDQNLSDNHRRKYQGRFAPAGLLLGGPRFALLGPSYVQPPPFVVAPEVRSIGIFMGGTDAADLTRLALGACRECAGFGGAIEIATTSANPHLPALRRLAGLSPATTISVDLPDLAAFFQRHDLQIGAGGGAAWERCCMGAPTLLLTAADNQHVVVSELVRRGAAAAPDPSVALTEASVGAAVRSLLDRTGLAMRQQLSERSQAIVDGQGAKRVALSLGGTSLTVRPATAQDAQTLHAWRNHPATRNNSHDARALAWDDHVDWLRHSLANPDRCLLVGQVGSIEVGVIRFDRSAPGQAQVSLYLDPALHGLGLGRRLLLAGEAHMSDRHGRLRMIATVLESNQGSQRMFQSCGYRFEQGAWQKHLDAPGSNRR